MLLSDVWRLSVAYIGNNSRIERHRKTKIGAQIAHVTRDSDTTFKDRQLQRSAWERIERGKLLLCCSVLCGVRREAALRRPHTEGGERRKYRGGRPPTACCVYLDNFRKAFDTVVTTFTPKLVISTAHNTLLLG